MITNINMDVSCREGRQIQLPTVVTVLLGSLIHKKHSVRQNYYAENVTLQSMCVGA
jgi:hypothetical protein